MRISDWSSDVCSSDLFLLLREVADALGDERRLRRRAAGRVDHQRDRLEARLGEGALDQRFEAGADHAAAPRPRNPGRATAGEQRSPRDTGEAGSTDDGVRSGRYRGWWKQEKKK